MCVCVCVYVCSMSSPSVSVAKLATNKVTARARNTADLFMAKMDHFLSQSENI